MCFVLELNGLSNSVDNRVERYRHIRECYHSLLCVISLSHMYGDINKSGRHHNRSGKTSRHRSRQPRQTDIVFGPRSCRGDRLCPPPSLKKHTLSDLKNHTPHDDGLSLSIM